LSKKRELLKEYTYEYNREIQRIEIDKALVKQNKDLGKLLEETLSVIKISSNEWVSKFEKLLEKEKFRSDLKKYFIVIIFGKVKAGKSSLGNFIAQNRLENEKVNFFKYDKAGNEQSIKKLEEIEDEGFDTNNLECTIEIQGFKLGGLAWIDTPGLGSMVEENGELAKEYIQSADYIIYPTSSDSPLQNDEISQLQELFEQNKKVTICITKSDTTDEDECECGDEEGCENCNEGMVNILVNKSEDRRTKQETYVKTEIEKIIDRKKETLLGDIFSISTHTALKGLETKNYKLLEESNIPKFYELITGVVKEKAVKLKDGTPTDGLKAFIDKDVLGESKKLKNELKYLNESITDSIEKFNDLITNVESDISSEIEDVIAKYFNDISKENSKEKFKLIDIEIEENISKIIEDNIKSIFGDFGHSLVKFSSNEEFEIEDIYEDYEYTTKSRNKSIGATILGTAATIGAAVATGGASIAISVGAATVAGMTGSYVGGKFGEWTGDKYTGTVNVGDNKNEILQKFKESKIDNYNKNTKLIYQQINISFFEPMKSISNEMSIKLENFETKITTVV